MSVEQVPGPPPRWSRRRRAPTGLLILIALLLAIALERSSRHAPTPPLAAVAFSDPEHGFGLFVAAGSSRCVASSGSTTDGGGHFGRLVVLAGWRCAGNPTVSQIATDGGGDAFAYGPALIASHDGGRHWAAVHVPGAVLAMSALGSSVWLVLRDCDGIRSRARSCPLHLLESADGGRRWEAAASAPAGEDGLRGALLPPAWGHTWLVRTGRASGYLLGSSTLAHTADGGASWARRRLPWARGTLSSVLAAAPDGTLAAICASEPSAGGQAKSLALSADGGRSWSPLGPCENPGAASCARSPLTQGYVGEAVATSARTVYVIGDRSGLIVTRDGGRRWRNLGSTVGDVNGEPAQVAFFGARNGVVLGRENTAKAPIALWHTSDGGRRWSAVIPSAAT